MQFYFFHSLDILFVNYDKFKELQTFDSNLTSSLVFHSHAEFKVGM